MIGFVWDYWAWLLIGGAAMVAFVAFAYVTKNWRLALAVGPILVGLAAVGRAHKQGADYEREQLARRNDAAKRRAEGDQTAASHLTDDEIDRELKSWGKH